ncbi:hypothetical protein [Roseibium alexandrii]|uniref:Uncharacterized protein n=1 Tax=Roseibium alexandrii (strain DSM 17067 / NCIMB 14079 / DFL-11) TaxID=244592 RepID=A0A5E8GWQ6_ROSAD|nr:hypothetical protein [Roseibium alexandrii]EEE43768.1 hypothetical protein SADFL11_1054 [Roseibium alexandrii DFL-11]
MTVTIENPASAKRAVKVAFRKESETAFLEAADAITAGRPGRRKLRERLIREYRRSDRLEGSQYVIAPGEVVRLTDGTSGHDDAAAQKGTLEAQGLIVTVK